MTSSVIIYVYYLSTTKLSSCNMYKCSRISNYWGILGVVYTGNLYAMIHLFEDKCLTKPWTIKDCQFVHKAPMFRSIFTNVAKQSQSWTTEEKFHMILISGSSGNFWYENYEMHIHILQQLLLSMLWVFYPFRC